MAIPTQPSDSTGVKAKPVGQTETVPESPGTRTEFDFRSLAQMPIPPMIQRSQEAFGRDLPELLKKRRGQWVAYHGDERIGFGRTETQLYQECFRRGLTDDEFVVRIVVPQWEEDIDFGEFVDVVDFPE